MQSWDGLLHGLSELDEPSRERPISEKRRTTPADQENPAPTDPNRINGERRTL